MLMNALHVSRRRQAERELHYYRRLVDQSPWSPRRVESSKPVANQSPAHRSVARRIATAVAIVLLAVRASLQIVGILIASRSVSSASESITLRGD